MFAHKIYCSKTCIYVYFLSRDDPYVEPERYILVGYSETFFFFFFFALLK